MSRTSLQAMSPRSRKRLGWALGLVLFYTVFGFLILPLIVRAVAARQLSKLLEREVTIETVRINPYVLSGTIRGLVVKDKDGERFVALTEGYGNLQLRSFFGRPWVFKEVRVVQPYVRARLNRDQTFNFSDLLDKLMTQAATPAPRPSKPLRLRVDLLRIEGAEAAYADLTTRTPFQRRIGPVELSVTGFRTDPDNKNPYSFSGTTDSGEKFSWSGYFLLDPIRSRGEFSLENLALTEHAALYQDLLRFEIRDGIADVRTAYEFAWSATNQVALATNASFRLRSLKVAEKDRTNTLAEVAHLAVTGASADAWSRALEVGAVSVSGGHVNVRRDADASVNLVQMATPAGTNLPGSVLLMLRSVTNLFEQLLASTNLARALVREIDVRDCGLTFEDLANPRPAHLSLTDISLAVTNLSNLPGANFTAAASLKWNTNGQARAGVTASVSPLAADVRVNLDQLALAPLGPYLEQFVSVFLVGSRLDLDGQIAFRTTNAIGPTAGFKGNLHLSDFLSTDGETGEELMKFSSVNFSNVNARLNPPEFTAAELAVRDLSARLVLETNGMLNVMRLARLTDTTNAASATESSGKRARGVKSFADLRREFGAMVRLFSVTNLAATPVPIRASIDRVVVSNGAVQVSDLTVQPPVALSVGSVGGEITGLSSDFTCAINAHLTARVGEAGPVEISAVLPPVGTSGTNRFNVVVRNMDLNPTGPYSGKYLGYGLRRGKLSLQADYQMTERKVKAANLVELDQFTFGEKVESPDATKLPVKLAVAILKDRNGRIELDVPVEGSLDDPEFRLGRVILHTFGNVITKLVTSPFAALGKLFGGKGEEVSFQEFLPGDAGLQPAAIEKLDAVVNGLYERPGLELEIEGSVNLETDRDALRHQKLEQEFRALKWRELQPGEREQVSQDQVTLTREEFARFVAAVHAERLGSPGTPKSDTGAETRPRSPSSPVPNSERTKGSQALLKPTAPPLAPGEFSRLESELLETVEITEVDYRTLATARASRVREHLLQSGKVEAERLLVAGPAPVATKGSRVYLQFR